MEANPSLRESLARRANLLGVRVGVLERDYALGHVLAAVYANESLRSGLAFKGGTALRKAHFGDYRFSADLDFTAIAGMEAGRLEIAVGDVVRATEQSLRREGDFGVDWSKLWAGSQHQSGQVAFKLKVLFPWHSRLTCTVKLEVTTDESMLLPPVRRRLLHDYGDDVQAELLCYSVEEIVAEKLRTPAQAQAREDAGGWARLCARDYYDLWYLLASREVGLNTERVAAVLADKCSARNVRVDCVDDVFPARIVNEAASQWESNLTDLVRPLPPFKTAMEDLRRGLSTILPTG